MSHILKRDMNTCKPIARVSLILLSTTHVHLLPGLQVGHLVRAELGRLFCQIAVTGGVDDFSLSASGPQAAIVDGGLPREGDVAPVRRAAGSQRCVCITREKTV